MNRIIERKPVDDTKLTFAAMGKKPGVKSVSKVIVKKKKVIAKKPMPKKAAKSNPFAKKAAAALVQHSGDIGKQNNGSQVAGNRVVSTVLQKVKAKKG